MSAKLAEISQRLRKAIEVGELVVLSKNREGFVRYKGPLDGKNGIFYGLELTKGNGKHNGIWKGKKRYFSCKKNKGIFIDKKQILYKRNHVIKKRASLSSPLPDIFHCDFLNETHGVSSDKKAIDPIKIIIKTKWDKRAKKAVTWKEKWQLLKELMRVICDDQYGKFELPNRFRHNAKEADAKCVLLTHLIEWLLTSKHLGSRKHILKILVPYCKTYSINTENTTKLSINLMTNQWKETKYGFRGLVTHALFSVYYASECVLDNWKRYLQRCLQSKSDVRVQVWNLLSQICILAAKTENTLAKQKALLDIELLIFDEEFIRLTKNIMNGNEGYLKKGRNRNNDKIIYACAEFIFGAKYILPDVKIINSVYNRVKENKNFMKDLGISEYCQLLVKGNNSFDLYQDEKDTIQRRKIWEKEKIKNRLNEINEITKCNFCNKNKNYYSKKQKEIENKMKNMENKISNLNQIVNELRIDNTKYESEIIQLRSNVVATNKKTELINDDIKEIEIEIFNLNSEIYKLKKNAKRRSKIHVKQNQFDLLNWDKWNCDDIIQWILSLKHGKYLKYKQHLYNILPMENIRGNELHLINEDDLIYFGIDNINHRKELMTSIKLLTSNSNNIPLSPPPIPFDNNNNNNDIQLSMPYIINNDAINNNHQLQQEGIVNQ